MRWDSSTTGLLLPWQHKTIWKSEQCHPFFILSHKVHIVAFIYASYKRLNSSTIPRSRAYFTQPQDCTLMPSGLENCPLCFKIGTHFPDSATQSQNCANSEVVQILKLHGTYYTFRKRAAHTVPLNTYWREGLHYSGVYRPTCTCMLS